MSDAIFAAYEALEARMDMVDIISNNLANAQTSGFKRDFAQIFEEVTENETEVVVSSFIDLTPGPPVSTGREMDAAIDGDGYFVIETEAGNRYSRNGSFQVNSDGDLVLKDGSRVMGDGDSPIFVGEGTRISIQAGGDVMVDDLPVGTLRVVTFDEPELLQKEGLFRLRWGGEAGGVQDAIEPRIRGGYLESSNVNPVAEMVALMTAFREFESVAQTIKSIATDMDKQLLAELADLT